MSIYTIANKRFSSIQDIEDSFRDSGLRIDLGCGYVKPAGFIGVDSFAGAGAQVENSDNAPDIVMDINGGPLPFSDNSCVEVRASHFLEHCNVDHVLGETFRVLRPDGTFIFAVPYANSAEGMYPGHDVFFTEKWFHLNIGFQKMFRIVREEYSPSDYYQKLPWIIRAVIPFKHARVFLYNACCQMTFYCKAKK
jgi:predicted SAM-dependent methyltransferase